MSAEQPSLSVTLRGINELHCVLQAPPEGCSFYFYVCRDGKVVAHFPWRQQAEISYWALCSGSYTVDLRIRDAAGKAAGRLEARLDFQNSREICCNIEPPRRRFDWLRNVGAAFREIWANRKRMLRITRFSYKVLNQDAYLGSLWNILNPLIQVGTFWFVFGVGLRGGRPIDGHPFLVWMLAGLIPWFFISQCITGGAASIRNKGVTALKMRYPVSTIPLEEVIIALYSQLVMLGCLFVTLLLYGYTPDLYWLCILYYLLYAVVFFTALGMVTSVLSMIAIDFQKLIVSLIRLLFYITPILWSTEGLPDWARIILECNPCLYIVDGFRDSLLYRVPFYAHPVKLAAFWAVSLLLLVLGCNLQAKYRNQFLELE